MTDPSIRSSAAAMIWREAPAPPDVGRTHEITAIRWMVAVTVTAIGPVVRVLWLVEPGGPWRTVLIVAGASVVTGLCGEKRWWLRAPVAVAAGAALVAPLGEMIAVWATAGIVLGDWAVRRWRPFPGAPRAMATAIAPAVILSGVAAERSYSDAPGNMPLIIVGLAFVVTAAGVASGGRLDRLLARFGVAVGSAFGRALFLVLAIPVLLFSALSRMVSGTDPLQSSTGSAGGWVRRRNADPQASKLWSAQPASPNPTQSTEAPTRKRRVRRVLASALPVAVIAAVATFGVMKLTGVDSGGDAAYQGFKLVPDSEAIAPGEDPTEIIYGSLDWFPTYLFDMGTAMGDRVWDGFGFIRMRDIESTYVNIADGVRASWTPPECGTCKTITVWMYGGSTGFGLGQRDEYTIASELSRAAWADGVRLVVENHGIPGDLHWREAMRFGWDLARGEPPDLVVFYDGVNDSWATNKLVRVGDVYEPIDPVMEDLRSSISQVIKNAEMRIPDGVKVPGHRTIAPLQSKELAQLTIERYDVSRKIGRDLAASNSVAIEFFWQPSRLSRPSIDGEPSSTGDEAGREEQEAQREALPADVHDLTQALQGDDRPMFTDDVHHDEKGSRLIGQAMYQAIRARIADMIMDRGAPS